MGQFKEWGDFPCSGVRRHWLRMDPRLEIAIFFHYGEVVQIELRTMPKRSLDDARQGKGMWWYDMVIFCSFFS